jgi:hypothetical protein
MLAGKENWNWSRTNMSFRLPNYVTGAKGTFSLSKNLDVSASVVNGWNRIVDDNDEKTVVLQAVYKREDKLTASLAYVGGVEREAGAPEGRPFRHTVDAWFEAKLLSPFSVGLDTVVGGEATRFGRHWYAGAAGYAHVHLLDPLWLALRADRLLEDPATRGASASSPILVPTRQVTSLTATLDVRPVRGLSIRLEGRHDFAASSLYYRGDVEGDGTTQPFVADARTQTTALLGVVAWF